MRPPAILVATFALFGLPASGCGDGFSAYEGGGHYAAGPPSISPDDATIVYSSPRSGRGDIYRVGRDGTGDRRLTLTDDFETQPAYSPDGRRIVYLREVGGYSHLWVMDADGSNQSALTSGRTYDLSCQFSADGKSILFDRSPPTGGLGLTLKPCRLDVATKQVRDRGADEARPGQLSPDGKTRLVERADGKNPDLWAEPVGGGAGKRLGPAQSAVYSPDGRRIFHLGPGYDYPLRVMDADGSNIRPITAPSHVKDGPVLSPDGKFVLVGCYGAERVPAIHVIRTDDLSTERVIPTR